MVDPGSIQEAVALILDNYPAIFTKADVSDAYKAIAVQIEQRKYQVYRIGNALFVELCLCFGDASAAHIFTGTHRAIIENFVLPFIPGLKKNLVLVVDDSIYVAGDRTWVEAYNLRYRQVMEQLNLEVSSPHQPLDYNMLFRSSRTIQTFARVFSLPTRARSSGSGLMQRSSPGP